MLLLTLQRITVAAIMCVGLGVATWAQDASSPPSLEDLSSDDYATRRGTMHWLWRMQRVPEVNQALESEDPEVRQRARWIQNQWDLGITPETPPRLAKLLRGEDLAEDVPLGEMIQSDELDGLVHALSGPNAATLGKRIVREVLGNFPWLTFVALENGKGEQFAKLLSALADQPIIAIRRSQLLHILGSPTETCLELPEAADEIVEFQRIPVEVMVRWHVGLRDEAIEHARRHESPILERLLIAHEDWEGLVRWASDLLEQEPLDENPELLEPEDATRYLQSCVTRANQLARMMFGQYRGGQLDGFQRSRAQLSGLLASEPYRTACSILQAQAESYDGGLLTLSFNTAEALVLVDEPELAIKALSDFRPLEAAEMLADRFDYEAAFDVLGVDSDQLDESLLSLADSAVLQSNRDQRGSVPMAFRQCIAACKQAFHVGHGAAARRAMRRLASLTGRNMQLQQLELVEAAMRSRTEMSFPIELAVPLLEQDSSDAKAAETLFGSDLGSLVWPALSKLYPNLSTQQRAVMLIDLSQSRLPTDWNRGTDLSRLAAELYRDTLPKRTNGTILHEAGQFFAKFSMHDWADTFDQAAAGANHVDAWMAIAEREFRDGHIAGAAASYENTWRQFHNHPEAIVGWAKTLALLGQTDRAQEIEGNLNRLVLDPQQYYAIAKQYQGFGDNESAIAYAQKVVDSSPISFDRYSSHYRALSLMASLEPKESYAARARLYRQRLDRLLGPINLASMAYYPQFAFSEHVERARVALGNKDEAKAMKILQIALRQSPTNIDFLETELLEIREQGWTQLADTILDQVLDDASKHLDRYPLHANMANNVAWVMSLHNHQLEKALTLSATAVSLFPDTFSYRDTLAEVLFRLGKTQQAIQVESNCLLDVPDDYHLHQQLDRFRIKQNL